MLDKDRIAIILKEYENQNDWERHNESQRAQISSFLLAISALIVTFIPRDKLTINDLPAPILLIMIGIFGILSILKYWERFEYHTDQENAFRNQLDLYFAPDNAQETTVKQGEALTYLFIETRKEGKDIHEAKKGLLQDKLLKQHWLWIAVFIVITLLGLYLTVKALGYLG
jgi:hypothetical protein